MRGRVLLALGASLLALGTAHAEPAASIRLLRADTIVYADGQAVQTIQMQIAVANDAAARADAQQSLTYSSDIENLELAEGYTLKPDGRRIPVLPGAVRTQLAPGTAEPVLVNLTPTYTLSGPRTLTAFNHVITYLPEWDIYADTTAGGAPFGTVPAQSYGKPILHVTAAGAPASRMATVPPGLATARLRTTIFLSAEGVVTGESVTESSGPYATVLRQTGNRILARGGVAAAAEQLRSLDQAGQGMITPGALDTMGPDYRVSSHFTLEAHPQWLEGDGFVVPTGMRLLPRPGDGLLGPLGMRDLPVTESTPCYAGQQTEELSLVLPPGYHPARLPRPRHIEHAAFSYDSRWAFADGTVNVTRKLVSRIDQPLCEGALRIAAAKALEEIRRDIAAQITLEKDG